MTEAPANEFFILPTGASILEISRYETRLLVDEIFERRVYPIPDLGGVEKPVIIDIGANIGVFAHYAKHVCPAATVYSVEPVPPVAEILRKNVAGLAGVRVLECAVAASPGEMEVTFYPGYSIMSRLNADRQTDEELLANCIRQDLQTKLAATKAVDERFVTAALGQKLAAAQTYPCQIRALPELLVTEGIGEIAFLKMDVEGSEWDILHGLPDAVWSRIQNLALEVHEYEVGSQVLSDLTALLAEKGYSIRTDHATAETCPRTAMLYGARGAA